MSDDMEWVIVRNHRATDIGAVGFVDRQAVIVVSFFDDRDTNRDGEVSRTERVMSFLPLFGRRGGMVAQVALTARDDAEIYTRDQTFRTMAVNLLQHFANGLVLEGIYMAYFSRGVQTIGRGAAQTITSGMVKELAVRKGFEAVVRQVFERTVNSQSRR